MAKVSLESLIEQSPDVSIIDNDDFLSKDFSRIDEANQAIEVAQEHYGALAQAYSRISKSTKLSPLSLEMYKDLEYRAQQGTGIKLRAFSFESEGEDATSSKEGVLARIIEMLKKIGQAIYAAIKRVAEFISNLLRKLAGKQVNIEKKIDAVKDNLKEAKGSKKSGFLVEHGETTIPEYFRFSGRHENAIDQVGYRFKATAEKVSKRLDPSKVKSSILAVVDNYERFVEYSDESEFSQRLQAIIEQIESANLWCLPFVQLEHPEGNSVGFKLEMPIADTRILVSTKLLYSSLHPLKVAEGFSGEAFEKAATAVQIRSFIDFPTSFTQEGPEEADLSKPGKYAAASNDTLEKVLDHISEATQVFNVKNLEKVVDALLDTAEDVADKISKIQRQTTGEYAPVDPSSTISVGRLMSSFASSLTVDATLLAKYFTLIQVQAGEVIYIADQLMNERLNAENSEAPSESGAAA